MAMQRTNQPGPPQGARRRPGTYSCGNGSERWLIITNCHYVGLAKALCLLSSDLRVDAYLATEFLKSAGTLAADLDSYQRILVNPSPRDRDPFAGLGLSSRDNVSTLPILYFDAYHPDSSDVFVNGKRLVGPAGMHSVICLTAFQAGLDPRETEALFEESVYERLGYFDRWDLARDHLVSQFAQHGYDIRETFLRWTRTVPFMHTPAHPHIHCLRDVARLVLERFGVTPRAGDALPPDNLADLAVWPVYPELALRLGVPGSHLFKPPFRYESIGLPEFIHRSFEQYRGLGDLALPPTRQPVADALREIIGCTTTPIAAWKTTTSGDAPSRESSASASIPS